LPQSSSLNTGAFTAAPGGGSVGISDEDAAGGALLAVGAIDIEGAGAGEVAGGVDAGHAVKINDAHNKRTTRAPRMAPSYRERSNSFHSFSSRKLKWKPKPSQPKPPDEPGAGK
jgi:hypothetical protein